MQDIAPTHHTASVTTILKVFCYDNTFVENHVYNLSARSAFRVSRSYILWLSVIGLLYVTCTEIGLCHWPNWKMLHFIMFVGYPWNVLQFCAVCFSLCGVFTIKWMASYWKVATFRHWLSLLNELNYIIEKLYSQLKRHLLVKMELLWPIYIYIQNKNLTCF